MAITGVVRVDRREIEISRPEKVLFPEDGISKGDLIEYYARIAPRMLPHLKDRPLTLERYPNGINTKRFFQKEVSSYFPKWIRTVTVEKVGGTVTHVVCNDTATLVYIANQACVTPHIFLSRTDKLDIPDQLVFDLDPQGDDFEVVRSTALDFRQLLDELGLPVFLKTTGSRGLHAPEARTMEQLKANRGERIFIDTNRNGYAQLVAPAYAVRARRGAPVSVPLDWSELKKKELRSNSFTIRNIFTRLERITDPWADFWQSGVSLAGARRKLGRLTG
jgi:bifunctional non-homologous end joining protein LigD